ncbi:MAG TPA: ATP-binding cassette domain-containing protein [Gemmatimonadales bacterium]|nr:ATP-binding cassette domain-containing protein [Gemmatimonadales bacterium]
MTTPHAPRPLVFEQVPLGRGASQSFTLEIPAHHTVAVLGDEDSGLGALGSYAMGLDRPPAGRALTFETDVGALPERERLAFRRRVGYLPAGEGLLQNLSLRDNIALPLRFGSGASPKEIDGRVNVMLAAVRLSGAGQLRPAQANEEERRRAALARAIAFDPSLLVLEQPFDGLTARVASELLELARGGESAEGARRTLFITGQEIPPLLLRRVERVYRLTRAGALEPETV